jgi:hypothetical protein
MAPAADRRTLIKRVYFDLLGLPPSFEEIEAFAGDRDPMAYEKLVDRLLASPHYGERWGRHWLDVARFAETCGYERDQVKPNAWKYRDWVIQAFNDDKPFDRFILEQLAGDELPDRSDPTLIATGFLRLGTWNDEPNDPQEYKYEYIEDMVHATSTAFLGLTVKCARCHDHKFDPIPQTDYYRFAATFWAGYVEPGPREWIGGPDPNTLNPSILGWTDRSANPPDLKLLLKGDPKKPGPVVKAGALSAIPSLDRAFAPPPSGAKTSHRRLQLAKWIADPKNPLPARVWVNRLWQHHFGQGLVHSSDNFGFTGDKPTHPELLDWLAAEFLANGGHSKPIHRLILLSETYRQASIHPRQEEYARSDAGNRYLWRAERQRRDAESLRDALLLAAGRLDLKLGGPSFHPTIGADALEGLSMKGAAWKASPAREQWRRSVYMFAKRSLLLPMATTFDFPDTTLPCCQRDVTIVPTQALNLLNNAFVHEQSEALAKRVADQPAPIQAAWRIAFGRNPSKSEMTFATDFLNQQEKLFRDKGRGDQSKSLALASLCHVLVNANEFMFVD